MNSLLSSGEIPAVPRDCVMQCPTITPEVTELVGFDWSGAVKSKTTCEASKAERLAARILAWLREEYPKPERRGRAAPMRIVR